MLLKVLITVSMPASQKKANTETEVPKTRQASWADDGVPLGVANLEMTALSDIIDEWLEAYSIASEPSCILCSRCAPMQQLFVISLLPMHEYIVQGQGVWYVPAGCGLAHLLLSYLQYLY